MSRTSAETWAQEEFGGARLCDRRWERRLVRAAARTARAPGGKVSEVFGNDAARQGAYGLLESRAVDAAAVAMPMFAATARRCREAEFVYCPVDGSSLTLVDPGKEKGFGPIGDRVHGARGLKVISALAVSPDSVPLGLLSQEWWARLDRVPAAQSKKRRAKRRTEDKETQRWLNAMEQSRQTMERVSPGTRVWFQIDREGDAWPIIEKANVENHDFTIRGSHDRRVIGRSGEMVHLRKALESESVVDTYELDVTASVKRTARKATMSVRACRLEFDFRDKRTQKHFRRHLNVVLAREEGTTPASEKPIDWLLITNRTVENAKQIRQVILGYAQRWRIEDFHRTWKSGACRVEESQLRSAEAVKKWATILAAVAVRIERIKKLARSEPERPASDEFTPFELRAIVLLRFGEAGKSRLESGKVPTLAEATTWLAQIGGYTGRSSGGPPGSTTLARGLQQISAAVRVLEALDTKK
jgi:hypothetical protein